MRNEKKREQAETPRVTPLHENQLKSVIDNYRALCAYCDSIWARVIDAYPNEIACRKGCGICCELQSVNQIEAYVIRAHIRTSSLPAISPSTTKFKNSCPFLHDDACSVYPARPIICRTHGLVLRSTEFLRPQAASCPYNFPSLHPRDIPEELTADIDRITKNLTKLNLAYCMLMEINVKDEASGRVMLADISEV